jgi:hypothetical protein
MSPRFPAKGKDPLLAAPGQAKKKKPCSGRRKAQWI